MNNEMNEEEASARLANMLNGKKVYKVRYIKSASTYFHVLYSRLSNSIVTISNHPYNKTKVAL